MVLKTLKENASKAKQILLAAVPMIAQEDWTNTLKNNQVKHKCCLEQTLNCNALWIGVFLC